MATRRTSRRRQSLRTGDQPRVKAVDTRHTVPISVEQVLARYAGRLTGIYGKHALGNLRREWR